MKLIIIILLFFISFAGHNQILLCQNDNFIDDFVYAPADDNVDELINMLRFKIDSVFTLKRDSDIVACCGIIEVVFNVNANGKVDTCFIQKSFRPDMDTLVLNAVNAVDLKKAAVYTHTGKPVPIRFMLPVNIDSVYSSPKQTVSPFKIVL